MRGATFGGGAVIQKRFTVLGAPGQYRIALPLEVGWLKGTTLGSAEIRVLGSGLLSAGSRKKVLHQG